MCFSPEASFAGGIIISAIGAATVTKVHNPSQIVFASIPMFFGIQQIAEGVLWMALPDPALVITQKISTYWFLIMAQVTLIIQHQLKVLHKAGSPAYIHNFYLPDHIYMNSGIYHL